MQVAVVEGHVCEACIKPHVLYFVGSTILKAGEEYEFTCPETKQAVSFIATVSHSVADWSVRYKAVPLRRYR